MTEYIVECVYDQTTGLDHFGRREEIVRCRDCKNYEPKDGTWLNCRFEIDGFIQWCYAEPDGFCKWGERRETVEHGRDGEGE